jgi:hypothetical protein
MASSSRPRPSSFRSCSSSTSHRLNCSHDLRTLPPAPRHGLASLSLRPRRHRHVDRGRLFSAGCQGAWLRQAKGPGARLQPPSPPHARGERLLLRPDAPTARKGSDHHLAKWLGERSCHQLWGGLVTPDGYVEIESPRGALDFFLELDGGTEEGARLAEKLDRYSSLAGMKDCPTPFCSAFRAPSGPCTAASGGGGVVLSRPTSRAHSPMWRLHCALRD